MFDLPLKQRRRQILHVDADAFFASVEQVLNPKLRGKPILVGGPSAKSGIVSTASYEAKKLGIYSGMPMYQATRRCPNAIIVPGNFKAYRDFSQRMYEIFLRHTPDVEMCSIDEAFLDISGSELLFKSSPREIARSILVTINKELGISVSCGLASNKTVAKVASSMNKPHKLTMIPFGMERRFLNPLKLNCIPGIGRKTYDLLTRYGFEKVEDIATLPFDKVVDIMGIQGVRIWKTCMGIDNRPVISTHSRPKSISKERTFYEIGYSKKFYLNCLRDLSLRVFTKLRRYDMKARNITLKLRYKTIDKNKGPFEDHSYQVRCDELCFTDDKLYRHVKQLFMENFSTQLPLRLIGVGVANLVKEYNLSLFANDNYNDRLFVSLDAMNEKFGKNTLLYGLGEKI